MKVRRKARALALQALFEIDSVRHDVETVLRRRFEDEEFPLEGQEFVRALVTGVIHAMPDLDDLISRHAPEYPVDQLAIVDRNILRLALFELLHMGDVPVKVAINEAVELAKLYGSDSAPRFVNGVLGAFLAGHPALARRGA
jgi:N utilization substance protein B